MIFSLRDYSTDRRSPDGNMGLLYGSGAPKPVFTAVQRLLRPRHRKQSDEQQRPVGRARSVPV